MRLSEQFARPRVAATILVVSLVLNGFLLGLLAVDLLRSSPHQKSEARVLSFELRRLADHLPESAVDHVATALESERADAEARLQRLKEMRSEIHRLAAAPQPDRPAIDARLEALRTEVAMLQAEIQRATFDALLSLPPEDRRGLAADAE